jgi:hypothetical protein
MGGESILTGLFPSQSYRVKVVVAAAALLEASK